MSLPIRLIHPPSESMELQLHTMIIESIQTIRNNNQYMSNLPRIYTRAPAAFAARIKTPSLSLHIPSLP